MLSLDPRTTALVLIDLQKGIVARPTAPRAASEVVANAAALAHKFRSAIAPVVLVRVGFAEGFADAPSRNVDQPFAPPPGGLPADWTELVEGLAAPGDLLIVKRQWGAFYGTELELQMRRRGVKTLVIGGVATNFGVESTARQAWELGFDVVLAEDCCATHSAELHDMAVRHIFPRLSHVVASTEIALAAS